MEPETVVLDRDDMRRSLARVAHEIVEKNPAGELAIVGVHRRGAPLARRIHALVGELRGSPLPLGDIDISFYRDDVMRAISPVLHGSNIPFDIDDTRIVLVDDVLYTGRTVRSALDALMDYGRPKCVQLAVMVDRGHRELPIRADYVGKNVPSSHEEDVRVRIRPLDDHDAVEIWDIEAEKNAGGAN